MFTKTHVMRLLLLIMIFGGFELQAQFSQTLKIKANSGKPVLSDILKSGVEYRITVTGEYSIWQEQLGNGVDAGYIYDVPQVLIDNDQWPAEEYIDSITSEKYKGIVLPAWVGDSTTFPYNTFLRQQLPFYEFNFKKWTGFRVDNQPLLNTGYRKDDHQYQFTKIGTGAPVSFAIIDSVLVPPSEDPTPAYSDNSGELTVFIEEVIPFNVNICSTSPILDSTKKMKGIRVDVSVLVTDTNKATGKKNILFDKNQVAIYENGKFICPDTIYCNKTVEAISVALVFDRTNSMEFGNVSNNDTTVRINAAIPAVKSFVNNLGSKDKALLLSFSDTNDVTLDKNWTSDKKQLNEEIDNYRKRLSQSENVGQTALHKALKSAISRTDLNESRVKAIVVLSDGADNVAPVNEQEVIDLLPKAGNIPIFIIALGMDTVLNSNLTDSGSIQFDREKVEINIQGLSRMRRIANASNGRLFYVTEANALENIYSLISKDIREEECCTIEYAVEDCEKNLADTVRTVMIYYPFEGGVTARATTYKTSCAKTFISKRDANGETYSKVLKVKTNKTNTIVPITLKSDNAVKINVIDNTGKTIKTIFEAQLKKGTHAISLDAKELSAGTYKAQVFVKGKKLSQHEITIQE
ncbi:MAG: VWA domain-containing protein [Ignavibacteriae bacterium]|jgi:hypothetical protein|nr:VWA domain-containing protein [Ignavibacteriota bacterium]